MELRYVQPTLYRLDDLDSELLFTPVFEDDRPLSGVTGLCDFRLGGRISRLVEGGFFTGADGDTLMMPGKPKTTFDKIVLFGAGSREALDERLFARIVRRMMTAMQRLRARSGVVELPGRDEGRVSPERAAEIILQESELHGAEIDLWVVVEEAEGRSAMERHTAELKRRRLRTEVPFDVP